MDFTLEEAEAVESTPATEATPAVDTYSLPAGDATPYNIMQNYWNAIAEMLDLMGTNHLSGAANFIDTMQFEGSQQGQAGVLGAIFKKVGEDLLGAAIGRMSALVPIPGLTLVLDLVKDAVAVANAGVERTGRAAAQSNLAQFSRNIRSSISETYFAARVTFRNQAEAELPLEYASLSGAGPTAQAPRQVTGEKAAFLRSLATSRSSISAAIPSDQAFQDSIAIKWITDSAAGGRGVTSDGSNEISNGKICVWVDSEEDDGQWNFEIDRITVYTASQGAQAADLLREAFSARRQSLWNCGIPVDVMFSAPAVSNGNNIIYECPLRSRQVSARSPPGGPEARAAWNAFLGHQVTWSRIDTIAMTRLEGGE